MANNKNAISFGQLDTNVENRLGFLPDINVDNGICMGEIVRVEFEMKDNPEIDDDGKVSLYQFKGLKTPQLIIEFKQLLDNDRASEERFLIDVSKPIVTVKNDGVQMTASEWNNLNIAMYNKLQHILNVFERNKIGVGTGSNLDDVNLKMEDAPELIVANTTKLLQHFYKELTGKDKNKPRWKDQLLYIKVVSNKKQNAYELPKFVRKGFVQLFKQGEATSLILEGQDTIALLVGKDTKDAKPDMNYKDADATSGQSSDNVSTKASAILDRLKNRTK